MIELLTLLEPGTSSTLALMIDNGQPKSVGDKHLEELAKDTRCRVCRGRKRRKLVNELTGEKEWHWCYLCGGTGQKRGTSKTASTSVSRRPEVDASAVAFLVAGMEPRCLWAALATVNKDRLAMEHLGVCLLYDMIIPESVQWAKVAEADLETRQRGLASLASRSAPISSRDPIDPVTAAEQMACSLSAWHKYWRMRCQNYREVVEGWAGAADEHMAVRYRGAA